MITIYIMHSLDKRVRHDHLHNGHKHDRTIPIAHTQKGNFPLMKG